MFDRCSFCGSHLEQSERFSEETLDQLIEDREVLLDTLTVVREKKEPEPVACVGDVLEQAKDEYIACVTCALYDHVIGKCKVEYVRKYSKPITDPKIQFCTMYERNKNKPGSNSKK